MRIVESLKNIDINEINYDDFYSKNENVYFN